MVDDPSSCPDEFPTEDEQRAERERLHDIIRRLVKWESTDESKPAVNALLAEARYEIARSVARSRGETAPTDPAEVLNYYVKKRCRYMTPSPAAVLYPLKHNGSG